MKKIVFISIFIVTASLAEAQEKSGQYGDGGSTRAGDEPGFQQPQNNNPIKVKQDLESALQEGYQCPSCGHQKPKPTQKEIEAAWKRVLAEADNYAELSIENKAFPSVEWRTHGTVFNFVAMTSQKEAAARMLKDSAEIIERGRTKNFEKDPYFKFQRIGYWINHLEGWDEEKKIIELLSHLHKAAGKSPGAGTLSTRIIGQMASGSKFKKARNLSRFYLIEILFHARPGKYNAQTKQFKPAVEKDYMWHFPAQWAAHHLVEAFFLGDQAVKDEVVQALTAAANPNYKDACPDTFHDKPEIWLLAGEALMRVAPQVYAKKYQKLYMKKYNQDPEFKKFIDNRDAQENK